MSISAAAILVGGTGRLLAADGDAPEWRAWADKFLREDGRVVDLAQGAISHSEGQGYGMLLAQSFGDEGAFRRMDTWAGDKLQVRGDHLMAWRWVPGRGVSLDDLATATDGDLFRAWALLRAGRDSGWEGCLDRSLDIARSISDRCLVPDPRALGEWLLRPGAGSRASGAGVLVNPSYIMPRALRELGEATGDIRLVRAADHGETLLAELADWGMLPDWIDVTPNGFAAPQEHELRSGYDAVRIPLYLAWSGRGDHRAVALGTRRLETLGTSGQLAVVVGTDGDVAATSDLPGYAALTALATCREVGPTADDIARQLYYPATLHLLAQVAMRERGDCPSRNQITR